MISAENIYKRSKCGKSAMVRVMQAIEHNDEYLFIYFEEVN